MVLVWYLNVDEIVERQGRVVLQAHRDKEGHGEVALQLRAAACNVEHSCYCYFST